jgi:hypothetical protein
MSSSKEPIEPMIINPGKLAIRLLREVTAEKSNIRRESDLPQRLRRFEFLADKLEFLSRVLPEINSCCLDIQWKMINSAIEEVEAEIDELRDGPEGWKLSES